MYINNKDLKTKEELELDLLEVKAYRDLGNKEFNFNGVIIKNTNEYNLGSEDAYYEMEIQSLEKALENYEETNSKQFKKQKIKINHYHRKMYWRKNKLLKQINNYLPYHAYSENKNDNGDIYYQRDYQSNKDIRKAYCKKIKRKINNCINEDYDICGMKGMNWKKIYNYKWDIY